MINGEIYYLFIYLYIFYIRYVNFKLRNMLILSKDVS